MTLWQGVSLVLYLIGAFVSYEMYFRETGMTKDTKVVLTVVWPLFGFGIMAIGFWDWVLRKRAG